MAVRLLLVLLTLTGLVPAGECTCASAHRHETDGDSVAVSPFADLADHDHDDSHPIHHHPSCPALDARLGLPVALAPAPSGATVPLHHALAAWCSWSPEQTPSRCCLRLTSRPGARALPLYLSQLTLRI